MFDAINESYRWLVQQIDLPQLAPWVLLAGVVMLLVGGRWLVNGSVSLARRLGVSTLIVGLTVVAFGTSAPELAFNWIAALNNNSELSFGNVIGSNIANLGLVLGLSAMVAPLVMHRRVLGKELPWLIAISVGTIVLALVPPNVMEGGEGRMGFSRTDGVILLAVFGMFLITWYRVARRDARGKLAIPLDESAIAESSRSLSLGILSIVAGLFALCAGGKAAEIGAVNLAETFHISKEVIGLTIVAMATSLPEVIAAITACRAGHSDLAVGNVIGSNIFNLLLVLGTTCCVQPVAVPQASAWFDLVVMTGLTILLLPLAKRGGRRISRLNGLLLLVCYLAYMSIRVAAQVL